MQHAAELDLVIASYGVGIGHVSQMDTSVIDINRHVSRHGSILYFVSLSLLLYGDGPVAINGVRH